MSSGAIVLSLVVHRIKGQFHDPLATIPGTLITADAIVVTLKDEQGYVGRGEYCGVGDDAESLDAIQWQIEAARSQIEDCVAAITLQEILPRGGARCALEAAFWDLKSKVVKVSAYIASGLNINISSRFACDRVSRPRKALTGYHINRC